MKPVSIGVATANRLRAVLPMTGAALGISGERLRRYVAPWKQRTIAAAASRSLPLGLGR
jgi:hypothetical protein